VGKGGKSPKGDKGKAPKRPKLSYGCKGPRRRLLDQGEGGKISNVLRYYANNLLVDLNHFDERDGGNTR